MYICVFNPTAQPVVLDDEGRSVAGGTWAPALSSTDQVRGALDGGLLVKVAAPAKGADVNPEAAEAFRLTTELEAARKKGPDQLADTADTVGATKTRAAARAANSEES